MDANRVSGRLLCRASAAASALCALGLSFPCFATLGGDLSSVQQDRTHLKASLSVSPSTGYSVHELKAATGTTVREYATADGRVFGVAWEGPWRPDLRQLLGEYFADYQEAARNKRQRTGLNGPLVSSTPRLVIEMSGRPRAFYGRAYIPDLVPSGVEVNGIR
jgi:hypothetical protein